MDVEVVGTTHSVCPTCLKQIPAERVRIGQQIYLRKRCPDHGAFQCILWRGCVDLAAWVDPRPAIAPPPEACPSGCGLCEGHLRGTCCVVLEVTSRCNLTCAYCLAGEAGTTEPTLTELCAALGRLTVPGQTLVQLSGGEPTLREDLPDVVAAAKRAGCAYVQLNTNGIRLGEDPAYARTLAEAGLSFVFMQFDGTQDAIHQALRGRPLQDLKTRAIAHCAEANLGVSLVPTLVPGVNTHHLGEILRFALAHAPAVRGVHFQPVSHVGRTPAPPTDASRYTLDALLADLPAQSGGLLDLTHVRPSCCDHPLCGFHGDFMVTPEGKLAPLHQGQVPRRRAISPAALNRAFVARRWQRPPQEEVAQDDAPLGHLDTFLKRVRSHGFTVTAMGFQDAWNLDLERLRHCSLHVFHQDRMVPFCAHYLNACPPGKLSAPPQA